MLSAILIHFYAGPKSTMLKLRKVCINLKQAEVDARARPGVSTAEAQPIKDLVKLVQQRQASLVAPLLY
jgi:hypothetical protein